MSAKQTVIAKDIVKKYKMYTSDNKRKFCLPKKKIGTDFFALKGITFEAKEGDSVGLVGLNGSGKSTLSTILAGVSKPSGGSLITRGDAALIAISSGLNQKLTGRENIVFKGLLIGLTMEEIDALTDSIIEFADIGEFINQPVKKYSSGMRARLGFAISVNINPDILIIDEALSVGDSTFTQKCLNKMEEFREKGKTIFFVSHSTAQVQKFCTKVMWLEYGMMKAFGDADEVLPMYDQFVNRYNAMTDEERTEYANKVIENQSHLLVRK